MDLFSSASPEGRRGLTAIADDPDEAVVALDFDGTLAPIVDDPRTARSHPDVPAALSRLAPALRALVVLTARPAEIAVAYGGFTDIERLLVLGNYGLERWENGVLSAPEPPAGVAAARTALSETLSAAGAPAGVWTEDKGQALAVHTRRTADPRASLERLRAPLAELAERCGLVLQPGRMVLELRAPGMDKGAALRDIVDERDGRSVLYAGDDLGDLPAFAAVTELRGRGVPGVAVACASTEVAELTAHADLVVDGPAEIAGLLGTLATTIESRHE